MQLTWAEKLERKVRKEGQKAGFLQGKQEALLRQLTTKFGRLPKKTLFRVRAIESVAQLNCYLDRVLDARSLSEMGLSPEKSKK
jgi:hypothetical protein